MLAAPSPAPASGSTESRSGPCPAAAAQFARIFPHPAAQDSSQTPCAVAAPATIAPRHIPMAQTAPEFAGRQFLNQYPPSRRKYLALIRPLPAFFCICQKNSMIPRPDRPSPFRRCISPRRRGVIGSAAETIAGGVGGAGDPPFAKARATAFPLPRGPAAGYGAALSRLARYPCRSKPHDFPVS